MRLYIGTPATSTALSLPGRIHFRNICPARPAQTASGIVSTGFTHRRKEKMSNALTLLAITRGVSLRCQNQLTRFGVSWYVLKDGSLLSGMLIKVAFKRAIELDHFINKLQRFGKTNTQIVFSTPVKSRGLDIARLENWEPPELDASQS
jgi:hypothetical protein